MREFRVDLVGEVQVSAEVFVELFDDELEGLSDDDVFELAETKARKLADQGHVTWEPVEASPWATGLTPRDYAVEDAVEL